MHTKPLGINYKMTLITLGFFTAKNILQIAQPTPNA